jgi:hypothetical protein
MWLEASVNAVPSVAFPIPGFKYILDSVVLYSGDIAARTRQSDLYKAIIHHHLRGTVTSVIKSIWKDIGLWLCQI